MVHQNGKQLFCSQLLFIGMYCKLEIFWVLTHAKYQMAFLRNVAWPQHSIENQEKWPEDRSLNCNTILQLDLYCKTLEKWIQEPISKIGRAHV